MVGYDLLLCSTRKTNSMPFLVFRRDHLRSTSGIICGSGSFAVQFGDHFPSGDHLCGRGSFVTLYSSDFLPDFPEIEHAIFFVQSLKAPISDLYP